MRPFRAPPLLAAGLLLVTLGCIRVVAGVPSASTVLQITGLSIDQGRVILSGSGLDQVTAIRLAGRSDSRFEILSKAADRVIAAAISASATSLTLAAGSAYSFIVSSASADTTVNISVSLPSGAVMAFKLNTCPDGWSPLDGSSGNPDLRGRTVIGTGQGAGLTSRSLLESGGEESHVLTALEMPSHRHDFYANSSGGNEVNPELNFLAKDGAGVSMSFAVTSDGAKMSGASIGLTGGGQAHNTMMPFVALLYCIKD